MGVRYLAISAACTVVSMIGLQCWTEISLEKFKADGLIGSDTLYSENASHIIELLLRSHATITLLAICLINAFVLFILSIKGTFLPLIIPPTIIQATLWMTWLTVLCFLKMFQALARDRLERLNASPSATLWTYFRVYSALLLVLAFDCLWIWFCAAVSGPLVSSTYWLLFFEPLSIAFETLQAIVVHGFQLMDIWLHHSAAETSDSQRSKFFDTTAGSLWEWKSNVVRNMGFFLDMMTLLMALGHYVLIWWLHGMTFHLVDAILFLNIRALLSAVVKRIKGFVKLKIALGALHEALPDATTKEIQSYDDECAICRASASFTKFFPFWLLPIDYLSHSCYIFFFSFEPMAKAKRLPCNHLFHLACLRSWLDQGLNEVYSCPTCRKPLFVGRSESEASSHTRVVSSDEQLARQLSSGVDPVNAGGVGVFPNQNQISPEVNPWRGAGADSSWLQPWPSQGLDGAGPSTAIRSAGLGRVQMMMRHLASVGENYAQTALEDTSWSLWPTNSSQATTSSTAFPPAAHRYPATSVSAHRRTASRPANDSIANLLAMAETVREVLPHIPDEMIFQITDVEVGQLKNGFDQNLT
uniref:RING-type domain-containing protein n=1 Tax=Chenopodium quinoa TaxID=63459 RepID=A0A803LMJ2_CHEQI